MAVKAPSRPGSVPEVHCSPEYQETFAWRAPVSLLPLFGQARASQSARRKAASGQENGPESDLVVTGPKG